jgi:hypothetical protein
MTLNKLKLSENKAFLEVKKDKNTLFGKVTEKELKTMPWMYGVNPVWSSIPGPYMFELSLSQKEEGSEIQKKLSIYNGNVFLIKDMNLNFFK